MSDTIAQYVIVGILIAAVIAIGWVAVTSMGVAVPWWVITILWILGVAVFAILVIKFLLWVVKRTP